MTAFVVAMLLTTLMAGGVLAWPYLRRDTEAGMRRRRANVLAYESRLNEIETEQEAGLIDAQSAALLRSEAEQQLLAAGEVAEPQLVLAGRRLWVFPLAVLVLAVLGGFAYWQGDSWRTQELIELAAHDPAAAQHRAVDGMVARLEARLKTTPDDAEGWAMLGRSYQVLGEEDRALAAYQRANGLSTAQPQADWLVAEGELRAMRSETRDLQSSRALFTQALAVDTDHPRALWYAGLTAAQANEFGEALDFWLRLRAQELPPDIAQLLDQRLPQLAELAGRELPQVVPQEAPLRLQLEVSMAPELRSKLLPGMVLFVLARAEEGPPMPLAVRRIASPQLPLNVTLDDSLAMMPNLKLSQFERWTVIARLSRSGEAQATSGDIEGRLSVSRAQAGRPLSLVLDGVVP